MSESLDASVVQKIQFEVEQESRRKSITFEYSEANGERLRIEMNDGVPYLVANQAGMLALAKLLMKVGSARRSDGFFIHLREHFDGDRNEVLRIMLEESKPESGDEKKNGKSNKTAA
jgi:hypothetical protein